MKAEFSPILDDQPAKIDSFDFKSYIQVLQETILHEKTRTPLTLGIFGRWGVGKTTLMRMLEEDLSKKGMITIWFNAWQYNNENELWAAFLQSLLNRIPKKLGTFQLPLFRYKLFLKRIRWEDVPSQLIKYLVRIIVVVIPTLLIDPISQQILPEAKLLIGVGGNIISLFLAVLLVGKPVLDSIRKNIDINNLSDLQKTTDYKKHIAFIDDFREIYSDIVSCLPVKGEKKIVIFVDDLDRCSSDRTLQVLDAIKLFADVEGCIYVLGLDADVVNRAIVAKYQNDPLAQKEYVSKIIQLPFQLPPLTRSEIQSFLGELTFELPNYNCQSAFVTGLRANPRELKRTINIFSLLWNLAIKQRGLSKNINPVRLAKIVVIQQGYPELYRILQERPYLLSELEYYFRKEMSGKEGKKFSSDDMNNGETGQFNKNADLPAEILPFCTNEPLREMLLLHIGVENEYNFLYLNPEEIAVYFTLTNRVDSVNSFVDNDEVSHKGSLLPGTVIDQRYSVRHEIANGYMSRVYLVHDQTLDKDVALKILNEKTKSEQGGIKRFQQEIKILSALNHPNLVKVLESGGTKVPYFTMPYYSRGSLDDLLKGKRILSTNEIVQYLIPVLDAIGYIHRQGVIHRDIKPSAILFDEIDEPHLADFGLIKMLDQKKNMNITDPNGNFIGTPLFIAPEQAQEGRLVDGRSDLYSFGVMLYMCLKGEPLFKADTPMGMVVKHIIEPPPLNPEDPDIPISLYKVLKKLLEKDPNNRYQTASDVREALLRALPN